MRRLVVLLAAALLTASLVPMAAAQEDDRVVFRVGLTQEWDTLNPTAGWLASEWEIWLLQYDALTNVAASDFETTPSLAESWVTSDDGLTVTYTLREGLQWSDGEPLTSEDIVWNIETSNEQFWLNHYDTTQNLTAVAIDERTVEITSAVPDPKLPNLGIWILPKHIWEPVATDDIAVTEYDGLDGVGSGPFVITDYREQQSVTMAVNPNWWGWEGNEPAVDEVVFRYFQNPDAMVAALQTGEIDAATAIPASAYEELRQDENVELVVGFQGGFDEIAINGGAGAAPPHPALLDLEVRRAVAFAIDTGAIIDDLWGGLAQTIPSFNPALDSKWRPEYPEENLFTYDPERANQILDDAGYADTDDDGIREMPDGTDPLVFRHLVNTSSDLAPNIGEFFTGWMEEIGIGVELLPMDSDQVDAAIIEGDYDTFYYGWYPGLDPTYMLSVWTTGELGNYSDTNWSDADFDALYEEQLVELDEDRRIEIVHEMMNIAQQAVIYPAVILSPDIQAYRTDHFEGFVRQPADVGPVIFSMTSPSYALISPVGAGGGDTGGSTNWVLIGGIAAVVVLAGVVVATRRGKSADQRE
jgi:peptide/nickel transport system substrate-binding protein